MCGIFGLVLQRDAKIGCATVVELLRNLFQLSESRGKESAGLYGWLPDAGEAWTLKGAQRASELLRSAEYRKLVEGPLRSAFDTSGARPTVPIVLLAHSRLVTNGAAELYENNQPVRWGPVTMIHNGIVVNVDELWAARPELKRHAEVDTEVMAAMAAERIAAGATIVDATSGIFGAIRGAASIAWVHDHNDCVVLATNTGDLYYTALHGGEATVFASERYILQQALQGTNRTVAAAGREITWLPPRNAVLISFGSPSLQSFRLDQGTHADISAKPPSPRSRVITHHDVATTPTAPLVLARRADETLVRYNEKRIASLTRCTRCVLPETFPFIHFDSEGVCNYCRSYRPRYATMPDPETAKASFIEKLKVYRTKGRSPDTLVAFSGGRDSSYGLHLISTEFGLKPITFTYDWGMVTDLARRNIARICGQLGIQNVLVSADIKAKRDNIRANVSAWLRQPDLGLVPLFMAGDKHFFRVTNQLKRQNGIKLDLWCANPLENTDFKAGFCGVPPDFEKKRVDYLSLGRQVKMAAYYAARIVQNPRYLNRSIPDTIDAFYSYYIEPRRDFYFVFDHIVWSEKIVEEVLRRYDWELAPDTNSTWRIGDGTAPFYNYIYMTARGFSEFDTFRSNQIRENMISREEAMRQIVENNRPRVQSLRWYLDTIGLDFDSTIRRINQLDVLRLHSD